MNGRRRKIKAITFSGLTIALIVVLLFLSSIIEVLDYTACAICGIAVTFILVEFGTGYAVFATTGNLLMLLAILHLPATVQYPIVTGGVIVLSAVADLIRKERVTPRTWVAVAVAFVASVVIAL